jgi:hypothetical protein
MSTSAATGRRLEQLAATVGLFTVAGILLLAAAVLSGSGVRLVVLLCAVAGGAARIGYLQARGVTAYRDHGTPEAGSVISGQPTRCRTSTPGAAAAAGAAPAGHATAGHATAGQATAGQATAAGTGAGAAPEVSGAGGAGVEVAQDEGCGRGRPSVVSVSPVLVELARDTIAELASRGQPIPESLRLVAEAGGHPTAETAAGSPGSAGPGDVGPAPGGAPAAVAPRAPVRFPPRLLADGVPCPLTAPPGGVLSGSSAAALAGHTRAHQQALSRVVRVVLTVSPWAVAGALGAAEVAVTRGDGRLGNIGSTLALGVLAAAGAAAGRSVHRALEAGADRAAAAGDGGYRSALRAAGEQVSTSRRRPGRSGAFDARLRDLDPARHNDPAQDDDPPARTGTSTG